MLFCLIMLMVSGDAASLRIDLAPALTGQGESAWLGSEHPMFSLRTTRGLPLGVAMADLTDPSHGSIVLPDTERRFDVVSGMGPNGPEIRVRPAGGAHDWKSVGISDTPSHLQFALQEGKPPVAFMFQKFKQYTTYNIGDCRVGILELDGNKYTVALTRMIRETHEINRSLEISIDLDGNNQMSRYTGPDDKGVWRQREAIPIHLPFVINGKAWRVTELDPDGAFMTITPDQTPSAWVEGLTAPNASVKRLDDGGPVSVKDYHGKWLMINSWGTGCAPCIREMPDLNKLASDFEGKVSFLAIASDEPDHLERFFRKHRFDYRQTYTREKGFALFDQGIPRHTLVNPKGKVVYDSFGAWPDQYEKMTAILNHFLAK